MTSARKDLTNGTVDPGDGACGLFLPLFLGRNFRDREAKLPAHSVRLMRRV